MAIDKPIIGQNNWGDDLNAALDSIDERLIAIETVVDEFVPLPSFLTYAEGRNHLPVLNGNFGWDSSGVWFSEAQGGGESYPIFTDFTIPTNSKVRVEFDVEIDSECSDAGVCIYVNGTTPQWNFGYDTTRIAAQFDCPTPQISGRVSSVSGEEDVPEPGVYKLVLIYDPADDVDNVIYQIMTTGNDPQLVDELRLSEVLPAGAYRVGFAADMDDTSPDNRTYISNLSISINNGATVYTDTLQEGNAGNSENLIVPVDIKDSDGAALLRFEKSYTGTTRIDALQDDLALRSARDILLYPGDDGEGKVYIGWGDADMGTSPNNEVATKGDLPSGATGSFTSQDGKTITVSNGIITSIDTP